MNTFLFPAVVPNTVAVVVALSFLRLALAYLPLFLGERMELSPLSENEHMPREPCEQTVIL